MKTFPFYYPVFSNRARKGAGGAPTDRSPRPRPRLRTGAVLGLAALGLGLCGTTVSTAQVPTPPPVVTPAPVPGGVTVVAPAGSTVVPGPSGRPAAVVTPGAAVSPVGTPATVIAPGAEPAPTPIPPGSTRTTTRKTTTIIPGATVSGGTIIPNGRVTSRTVVTSPAPGVITSAGVVDVYEPGARFVVREETGPVAYTYGPQTVYSTPGGVILTAEQVRTRMRAGLPVRVEYITHGDTRVIQRVLVEDRYLRD